MPLARLGPQDPARLTNVRFLHARAFNGGAALLSRFYKTGHHSAV